MEKASLVDSIRNKYKAFLADLDERASRRWAAAEAISLGRGGITAVRSQPESQTGRFVMGLPKSILHHRLKAVVNGVMALEGPNARARNPN